MLQSLVDGVCAGLVLALFSSGFGLIYTTTRVFHVSHGALSLLGGYAVWYFMHSGRTSPIGAIVAALVAIALSAVAIDLVFYRPLQRLRAPSSVQLITALGVAIVVENLTAIAFGNEAHVGYEGVAATYTLGGLMLTSAQAIQLTTAALLLAAFWGTLRWTRAGITVRAVANDPDLAAVLGVNTEVVRIAAVALGALLGCAAGVLTYADVGVEPSMAIPMLLNGVVGFVLGGGRSLIAPIAGSLFLGIAQAAVGHLIPGDWSAAVTFGTLVLVVTRSGRGRFTGALAGNRM